MEDILSIAIPVVLVSLFSFYSSYSIKAGIYLRSLCEKDTDEKVVALTFDDGPHPEQTPKVLEILRDRGVEAAFFCIGENIENNRALTKRIDEEGHVVGNHSYCHSWKFPWLGYKKMEQNLRQCDRIIEEVIGKKTSFFRPPFGVTNPMLAKAVTSIGYISIGWNIRSFDTTCRGNQNKVIRRIEKKLKPGSIILLHDNLSFSDELLVRILDILSEKGYRIERVDKLLGRPDDTAI